MKKLFALLLCFSFMGCAVETYVVPYVNMKKAGPKRHLIWNDRDTVYSMVKYTILKFNHKPKAIEKVDSLLIRRIAAE